jgi:hypothetical protein
VFQLTPTRKFSSYKGVLQLQRSIPADPYKEVLQLQETVSAEGKYSSCSEVFNKRVVFQPQKSASAAGKRSTYKIMF